MLSLVIQLTVGHRMARNKLLWSLFKDVLFVQVPIYNMLMYFFLKNVVESSGEKMEDRNESMLENCCVPCKDAHISLFILCFLFTLSCEK